MQRININTPYYINEKILNNSSKEITDSKYNVVFNKKVKEKDIVIVVDYIDKENPIESHLKENVLLWKSEPNNVDKLRKKYINQFGLYISNLEEKDLKVKTIKSISPICFQTWIKDKNKIIWDKEKIKEIKTKNISLITSNHLFFGLHFLRYRFVKFIFKNKINWIDIFGFYEKIPMEDGLLNYKYTIVLENTEEKNIWSEKLTDAMRMKCFIFYFGSKNIEKYFDMGSIVKIDIRNPKNALNTIKKTIEDNLFEKKQISINNNFEKAVSLSIKDHVVNIIKENNIIFKEKNSSENILFKNEILKPRTNKKIAWKVFLYTDTYKEIFKKIFKIIKMKISKKYKIETEEIYARIYKNIK